MRKVATQLVKKPNTKQVTVTSKKVHGYLGVPKFKHDRIQGENEVGVATGMAWTPMGGELLFTEVTLMHGTVGLLHASMGIFQAWADRVPIFAVVAHSRNPTSVVNRPHSAQDMGAIVRDFVKMDDEATNLERFASAAMRAYTIGRTPPMGPTLLVVDSELQEEPIPDPRKLTIPRLSMPSMPQGDSGAVREAARLLATAERPLIRTGKLARTSAAVSAVPPQTGSSCR